jgi:chemotaxis protein MotA
MGVIFGFLVFAAVIVIGLGGVSSMGSYWDAPSMTIVLGGTLGIVLMMFGFGNFFSIPLLLIQMLLPLPYKEGDIVTMAQRMADKVKAAGVPALTSEIPTAPDEFTRRGIKMIIAGTDSSTVRAIMEKEIEEIEKRHSTKINMFNLAAAVFPAMGLLGTILGLVQVLANLEDTSKLGPSMALALITTLYGAFFSNVIAMPMGQTLQVKNDKEVILKNMVMEGLLAVQAGESSYIVGQRLKAYCNEGLRAKIEGGKGTSKKKTEKHVEIATYMNAIDQEKAMAFLAEVKKSMETKDLGQDDAKNMLAELINEAEDKIIMKDFANEFMKSKTAKKLPKGLKRKGVTGKKGKGAKAKRKAAVGDEDE